MSEFGGTNALVVGGAGFVGGNLVRELLARDAARVLIVDNLLSAERENVPDDPRVAFLEGSIADDAVLAQLHDEFDHVFHLATYHGNQSSIANPLADHEHNLFTTLKLFERIKGFKRVRKVVYAASGCTLAPHTYGEAEAVVEDGPVPLDLDSPYQISKVVGEFYSVYYHRQEGLPTVRARFQNVYGPGEILGAGRWRGTPHTVWRNVTPTFVWKALNREALPVENGGIAGRDFIFVDDIARGLIACAERGEPGEAYNLASGVETSILDLAELINELTDNPTPIALSPARDWDRSGHRFGDPRKAKEQLGFGTETALRDGLGQTIAWTRANRETIRRCMLQHARFVPGLRAALA